MMLSNSKQIYCKVLNREKCHFKFQYKEGLNILIDEFNSDVNTPVGPGGLYFTTLDNFEKCFYFGCSISIVELPINDEDFKIVSCYKYDIGSYRTNKIILGKNYSFDNIEDVKFLLSKNHNSLEYFDEYFKNTNNKRGY